MMRLPPIRYVVPVTISLFAAVFAIGTYLAVSQRIAEQAQLHQGGLAEHGANQLSSLLRRPLSRGDLDTAQQNLDSITTLPTLRAAYLVDSDQRILLATRERAAGQPVDAVELELDTGVLAAVRGSGEGEVRVEGETLWGVYPLDWAEGEAAAGSGLLVMKFDSALLAAQPSRQVLIYAFYVFCIALALGVLFYFYLHWGVVRRVERLAHAIRIWRPGESMPSLSGEDEIADLSNHFSELADQLTERNDYLQTLFQRSFQLAGLLAPDGRLLEVNDHALELIGARRADVIGSYFWDTPWWNRDRKIQAELCDDVAAAAEGRHILREATNFGRGGKRHTINMSLRPIQGENGEIKWLLAEGFDITPLVEAQERSRRLNAFYATLSQTNSAIVRAENESEMLQSVCRIIVEQSGISAAWVGFVDQATSEIRPASGANMNEAYAEGLIFSVDEQSPAGKGPVARAVRGARHCVVHDFLNELDSLANDQWVEKAVRAGIRSVAAFPLFRGGEVVGALSLYAAERDLFTEGLIALLDELAEDISFALDSFQRRGELRLLGEVFDSAHEIIVILNSDGTVRSVNKAFTDITGYEADEVVGKTGDALRPEGMDDDYFEQAAREIEERGFWQGEVWFRRKNGETYPAIYSLSAVRDRSGELTHYVCVSTDISEHKETEERVRFLAYNDTLTGLPNRALLRDRAEQAFNGAERSGGEVGLMFFDLDQFKHVNESLGHAIGDALLKEVAKRLSSTLRESDTLGRLGGDEFLVILPDTDANEIAHMARDLLDQFNYPFDVRGHVLSITASAGITVFPHDGETFNELHQHADVAMYKAKELGRHRYHFFTAELNSAATDRLIIENALRNAVDSDELSLHYQPQIDVTTGGIVGFEALLRWNHPKMGNIPPNQFISIAEDTGMIERIGARVMLEACRECKRWSGEGPFQPVVAVNVSFKQFMMTDMYDVVREALQQSQLDPSRLEIEITESLLAADVEKTLATLNEISELGVRIAVDDFGTGYSSLSYLKRFPLDKLKIDQSFIRDLVTDKDDREIAAGIINLGHSLELSVIAEGVETGEQLELLRRMNCDVAQGYFFSRPLPADNAADYLTKASRVHRRVAPHGV